MTEHVRTAARRPYVGDGEDGARRSAAIDLEEADGLDPFEVQYEERLASARAWEAQAEELMKQRLGPRPTLEHSTAEVGNEDWLAGLALLKLSPVLQIDAGRHTVWGTGGRYVDAPGEEANLKTRVFLPDPEMDWAAWAADVDDRGRGWSSTEWALFGLVAGLTVRDRQVSLREVFNMGSWEREALSILVEWASGGNQREHPGRVRLETHTQTAAPGPLPGRDPGVKGKGRGSTTSPTSCDCPGGSSRAAQHADGYGAGTQFGEIELAFILVADYCAPQWPGSEHPKQFHLDFEGRRHRGRSAPRPGPQRDYGARLRWPEGRLLPNLDRPHWPPVLPCRNAGVTCTPWSRSGSSTNPPPVTTSLDEPLRERPSARSNAASPATSHATSTGYLKVGPQLLDGAYERRICSDAIGVSTASC